MAASYLTLIETGGNQAYIFGSNRLREVVGASELLWRAGTVWVVEAVKGIDTPDASAAFWEGPPDADKVKAYVRDPVRNPPIGASSPADAAEVVIAASGKAVILTDTRERAAAIVERVTLRALAEAPGLAVLGATVGVESDSAESFDDAVKRVHERHQELRALLPGPEARFPRLPVLDECGSTGLPASGLDQHTEGYRFMGTVSEVTRAKRDARNAGWKRVRALLGEAGNRLLSNFDKLDKLDDHHKLKWVGVVHADGNGVGKIFLGFPGMAPSLKGKSGAKSRDYITDYRAFSLALEECTAAAVSTAILKTWPKLGDKEHAPIVPLVLGGDDLTVVCDGAAAAAFAAHYLAAFEAETGKSDIVAAIAGNAFDSVERLSAAAGVAIVKPHFPFHRAYELCDELAKSAKQAKAIVEIEKNHPFPCSTLDFHVLFDSSGADLKAIRERLEIDDQPKKPARLAAGPYVVTKDVDGAKAGQDWAERRSWTRLLEGVEALKEPDEEKRLPRTQQHALREGLFAGPEIADGRLRAIHQRYPDFGWKAVTDKPAGTGEPSLFFDDPWPPPSTRLSGRRARLLDAMMLADVAVQTGRLVDE